MTDALQLEENSLEKKTDIDKIIDLITDEYGESGSDREELDIVELLTMEIYQEEIADISEIMFRFKEHGIEANIATAEDDLMKASALLVRIGELVGFLDGRAEDYEERRKSSLFQWYLAAKKTKDIYGLRCSEEDAKAIARVKSADVIASKSRALARAKMMINYWFGLQTFIKVLDRQLIKRCTDNKYVPMSEPGPAKSSDDTYFLPVPPTSDSAQPHPDCVEQSVTAEPNLDPGGSLVL